MPPLRGLQMAFRVWHFLAAFVVLKIYGWVGTLT
jgi:hypothetical protein